MADDPGKNQMHAPAFRFEWNLNTVATLVSLGIIVFGGGAAWQSLKGDQNDFLEWRKDHEQLHKDRQSEITGDSRAAEERVRGIESRLSVIDNLAYRLTVNEQSTAATAQVLKEVQAVVNKQAVDQATMLAILNRIDNTLRTATPTQ
jgi:hypothetical protein